MHSILGFIYVGWPGLDTQIFHCVMPVALVVILRGFPLFYTRHVNMNHVCNHCILTVKNIVGCPRLPNITNSHAVMLTKKQLKYLTIL
jgi:hypothetical protein